MARMDHEPKVAEDHRTDDHVGTPKQMTSGENRDGIPPGEGTLHDVILGEDLQVHLVDLDHSNHNHVAGCSSPGDNLVNLSMNEVAMYEVEYPHHG